MSKNRRKMSRNVCFGCMAPGDVRMEYAESLASTFRFHAERSEKVLRAAVFLNSGPRVAEGRSQVVDEFAKSGCDWLFMVDSDMVWQGDALHRMLNVAEAHNARIVGGLCFGGRGESAMFPTIYEFATDPEGVIGTRVVEDYPENAVVKVAATGAAFLLIHKSVFVEMKAAFGTLPNGKPNPYPWFVEAGSDGRPIGEDIAFCLKANALGIDILVDTSIKVGHIKTRELNEEKFREQQRAASKVGATPLQLPEVS